MVSVTRVKNEDGRVIRVDAYSNENRVKGVIVRQTVSQVEHQAVIDDLQEQANRPERRGK
jgi:hypothetical protein